MSETLLEAGAILAGEPADGGLDTVTARAYTHPASAASSLAKNTEGWRRQQHRAAFATIVPAAAPPPMTTTAAADGTSQRSAGLDLNTDTMSTSR